MNKYSRWIAQASAAFPLIAALAPHAVAQEAEVVEVEESQGYGFKMEPDAVSYSGEEIFTVDGAVILYRPNNSYDGYEANKGSNATLIDMKTGEIRMIVPEGGKILLLNLDIVYGEMVEGNEEHETGVGYIARVGTEDDYEQGRIDLIVGRLSDLEQRLIFENVRFVDSPTAIDNNNISMIVWPEGDEAQFVVVDLETFTVTKREPIDLPKLVKLKKKNCECSAGW